MHPFDGSSGNELPEPDAHGHPIGCSYRHLVETIQCSEAELLQGLRTLHALEYADGWWCLLTDEIVYRVLQDALTAARSHEWELEASPVASLCIELRDRYPREIILHVLDMVKTGGEAIGDDVCLSFSKVATIVGLRILQDLAHDQVAKASTSSTSTATALTPAQAALLGHALALSKHENAGIRADMLLPAWTAAMPPGSVVETPSAAAAAAAGGSDASATKFAGSLDIDLLNGNIVCELNSAGAVVVRYLPSAELAADAATRFKQLFTIKTKWKLSELEPFIQPLVGFGKTRDDLLLQFTRSTVQPDGSRLFGAR